MWHFGSRRQFIAGSIGAGIAWQARSSLAADQRPAEFDDCLDSGRSFIGHGGPFNAVRFWVESRTTIFDDEAGKAATFYQCGSCKSERTFAERDLFNADNYDFMPIIGDGHVLLFRRHVELNADYRDVREAVAVWGEPIPRLQTAKQATVLDSWPKIQAAIESSQPIVARTNIADATTKLRAVIEDPVKTMNMNIEKQLWQLDTGPIALHDLSKHYEPTIESLRLAFVAANRSDFADFVIEQPTPVVVDGKTVTEVRHYSGPISMPAENVLLAIE